LAYALRASVAFALALGPSGEVVREAGDDGARALPRIRERLAAALRARDGAVREDGSVWLSSSSWLVTAQRGP